MQFVGVGAALELRDVPGPEPEAGWVVLDVEAVGLCHTDIHVLHGAIPGTPVPITLGHEVAGTIAVLGAGVDGFRVGEWVVLAIDSVRGALADDWSLVPGIRYDGGYAEQVLAHEGALVRIPDGVSFAQAAVATDSVATAYHAVRTIGEAKAGQTAGIIGLGGLGLMGAVVADICGCTVYGVDINTGTFDAARGFGVRECYTDIGELAAVAPDLIVDFAGVGSTTADAGAVVRAGGRIVLVGLGRSETAVRNADLVNRMIQLHGSIGSEPEEVRQVLDLIAAGRMQPVLEEVPFETLPESLGRLERGEVVGRLYTRPRA
ncbi:zinc-binding dehydrogenase [Nocardia crassostreae]|uniref:zinc-binding dehydrogenase n=1 Tax=Nocardia crassostreae TaxID=53428 RepID=UPI001FE1920A|nr:zinc-binding dehydrogenase [Nocardia crassostreae]